MESEIDARLQKDYSCWASERERPQYCVVLSNTNRLVLCCPIEYCTTHGIFTFLTLKSVRLSFSKVTAAHTAEIEDYSPYPLDP